MTHDISQPRKTAYLGCLGYNDSPDELGEPSGFWHFSDEGHMWSAFARSQGMNEAFETLGEPTYSAVLLATDADGYALFHLLVISVEPIYPREAERVEQAKGWLAQA